MTTTIAVAGKGGTGKTAISALIVHFLSQLSPPVLAVDGDPATNLHQALGIKMDEKINTIGGIREYMEEKISRGEFPPGISKQEWLDAKIREGLVEEKGFDLLCMGRSEGRGCYCAVNHMLRSTLDRLSKQYRFVVIDNEAGMEHISRQTTNNVDFVLIISGPSVPGVMTAIRTERLIRELRSNVGEIYLVLNQVDGEIPHKVAQLIKEGELRLLEVILKDQYIGELEAEGRPIVHLPDNSPLKKGALKILKKLKLVP